MKLHATVLFLLMTTLLCACNDNRDSWADNYQMAFMDMMFKIFRTIPFPKMLLIRYLIKHWK